MTAFEPDPTPDDEGLADLLIRRESIDDALRKLGLYVEDLMPYPGDDTRPPMLIVSATVGQVAFQARVQEDDATLALRREFDEIVGTGTANEFLDLRAELAQRLADGEDPLG